jgi:hypothetical protein
MDYDFAQAIWAIHEVEKNIWLGDMREAKRIADSAIEEVEAKKIKAPQATANRVREILKQKRKDAKGKTAFYKRQWVADQVLKTLRKAEINMTDNLYGVLLNYLSDLRDSITYLIKTMSQTTLPNEEKPERKIQVYQGDGYRYTIHHFPEKTEVRAILDKLPKLNIVMMKTELSNFGYALENLFEAKFSKAFMLYSEKMYVQVLSQEKQAKLLFYTPELADKEEKIRLKAREILNLFSP